MYIEMNISETVLCHINILGLFNAESIPLEEQ